jgi:arsenate reductase
MDLTIYYNPRCRKSREALNYLIDQGHQPNVVLYLKNSLNKEQLKKILIQIDMNAIGIIRKNEADWKSHSKQKRFV